MKGKKRGSLIESFHNPEQRNDNVHSTIALIPQLAQLLHRIVYITLHTCTYDGLYNDRVRLIAYFKNVVA